jgi:hypothetical protein
MKRTRPNLIVRILSLIIALCAGLLASTAYASTITMNLSDSYIVLGESFSVSVYAQETQAAGDLTAFGFLVDPNSSLSIVSFSNYMIGTGYIDYSRQNHVVGVEEDILHNAGNNILLAILDFTATSIGTNTLNIEGKFDSDNALGLYWENLDADITGSLNLTVHPVPLPATLLLLGSGLLGLAGFRKKMKKGKCYIE